MKKVVSLVVIVIICICLCSCGKDAVSKTEGGTGNQNNDFQNSISSEYQEDNEKQTSVVSRSTEEVLAYYSELYSAKSVYGDKFNTLKYVLVSEKNIVEILAIDGLEQTKMIPIDNIERVENKSLSGFNEIKVFDKTNQNISVILDSDKAEELLSMID